MRLHSQPAPVVTATPLTAQACWTAASSPPTSGNAHEEGPRASGLRSSKRGSLPNRASSCISCIVASTLASRVARQLASVAAAAALLAASAGGPELDSRVSMVRSSSSTSTAWLSVPAHLRMMDPAGLSAGRDDERWSSELAEADSSAMVGRGSRDRSMSLLADAVSSSWSAISFPAATGDAGLPVFAGESCSSAAAASRLVAAGGGTAVGRAPRSLGRAALVPRA